MLIVASLIGSATLFLTSLAGQMRHYIEIPLAHKASEFGTGDADLMEVRLPRNVLSLAAREIIGDFNLKSLFEKQVGDVRADKAGSAGYEDLWQCGLVSFRDVVGSGAFESEQVARSIYDSEAAPVGCGCFQAHTWLVKEFVHQRFREMLDGIGLCSGKWADSAECCCKFRTAKPVHLFPELSDDRHGRQSSHPIPVFLGFVEDHGSRRRNVFLSSRSEYP